MIRPLSRGLLLLAFPVHAAGAAAPNDPSTRPANVDVTGVVTDSTNGQPLQSAEISVARATGGVVSNTVADGFGRFTIHNLAPGSYTIAVHLLGFRPLTRPLTVDAAATAGIQLRFAMMPVGLNLDAVQVTASAPVSVDTRTGDQIFKQNDYHGAPTTTTSQILQQSIVGAARAPTGEVHIRGQHAEYTYYIDGVPVPPGISGSFNELFDPQVVNQISFQTGGWDAEYGNRVAAVVNVTTKIPSGGLHANVSSYVGAFQGSNISGAKGFNGQAASVSGNNGPWGVFVSGGRQFTDMRLEPIVFDSTGKRIVNFHNDGTDYFGFAKLQFAPGTRDLFALDLNISTTNFAVPFDSSGSTFQNDHQKDANSFINLGWHHQIGEANAEGTTPADFFAGVYFRHATLNFNPDPNDQPSFQFFPDTTLFNIAEDRNANTYGIKADYAVRPAHEVEFKFGTQASAVTGHEDFSTFAGSQLGPQSAANLTGSDVGVYAQTAFAPQEWLEIRTGVRYDAHRAPNTPVATQVSPRFRLNLYPSTSTTAYLYYGRLFTPTNVEDLRAITSAAQGGSVDLPTQPERDHFFEAGLIQRLPDWGLIGKLSAYYKKSDPGIDDNTVPNSAIKTEVNIEHVRITGIEGVLELRPRGPFSGYVNAALNHAYGFGAVTGGFFPSQPPTGSFDLDHDQRLSIAGSATYSPNRFFMSASAIYGSGLTNGVAPADCNCSYGTGLFDFNSGIHVSPTTIYNTSAGYTLIAARTILQPEVYVENLFNKTYVLKGAFFSGPAIGRPRSIQVRMKVGF